VCGIIPRMARKRVFLDECVSDLGHVFGLKAHVYTAHDLGMTGKEDTRVIEMAFKLKCLIVTVNKDFLDYYYNHPRRKGKRGVYFMG
jgi:predicted nuclease of predicted toxin-antitoxin system